MPVDGSSIENGEVVDYLDNDEEGYRMPMQLLPKGIAPEELRRNDVKWKEFLVTPSNTMEGTSEDVPRGETTYDACTLCSCMGPTDSWCTCPHAALTQMTSRIGVDAVCHPWSRSSVLCEKQLAVDTVGPPSPPCGGRRPGLVTRPTHQCDAYPRLCCAGHKRVLRERTRSARRVNPN